MVPWHKRRRQGLETGVPYPHRLWITLWNTLPGRPKIRAIFEFLRIWSNYDHSEKNIKNNNLRL